MPPFTLSPSRIARFFYHECDRYLRYHATPIREREAAGVPSVRWDTSPVTKVILEGGFAWEEKVIGNLLEGRVKISAGSGPLHKRAHEIKETLSILEALGPDQAIYQPTLKVPETFIQRYNLDPKLCDFPPCRPDLIHLTNNEEGNPRLRIVDIKASNALKESHRVQAAIYVLMLRDILEAKGLNLPLDVETAGIWLFEQAEPEWFDLGLSISIVERFFMQRLPGILSKPLKEVPWHLFFRCEWCEFYPRCRKEAEENRSVSLVPYLSPGGRAYLGEAPWDEGSPANTLDDLEALLKNEAADKILEACGSLRGKGDRLRNAVQSLKTSQVVIHGGASLSLPVHEHVAIVMTLQDDPVSGQIYAAGFRRLKGKAVYGNGSNVKLFVASTPQECTTVCHNFLKALFDELQTLHDHNDGKEWKDQKSLQSYVFDGYELTLFNKLLLESLNDPSLASLALQMLFYFQDTSLADADEHPTEEVPFPVIILTGVIQQLVALPIPLYLRLPEVCKALPAPGFTFTIDPHELFWFELSNTLKSDAIFQAWNKGRKEAVKWVEDELSRRLIATNAILEGLRAKVKDRLFAWPPKFRFPGALDFKNPELSRLAFVVRYESFMGAVDIREKRTRPWGERVREGVSIPLKKMSGDRL